MKLFKEIRINHLAQKELLQSLVEQGVQFNKYAPLLFEHPAFQISGEPETVQLVKVSLRQLGFDRPAIFGDIVERAKGLGLKLCPLVLAAYLRLEYLDQPEGPYLKVASPKAGQQDHEPRGLYLRNLEGVLWLRGYCASDDWEAPLEMEFVFRL